MAALALTEAMVKTLADHFRAALPAEFVAAGIELVGDIAAHIAEDWESQSQDLIYPTVGIDAPIPGERGGRIGVPVKVEQPIDPSDPNIVLYLQTAVVSTPLQVNIWADSKFQRSRVLAAVEAALIGDILEGSGMIRVDSVHYHGLSMSFRRDGTAQYLDSAGTVGKEEWRAVLTVVAESHEVVKVNAKRLIELELRTRAARWHEIDKVPEEIRTIFEPV